MPNCCQNRTLLRLNGGEKKQSQMITEELETLKPVQEEHEPQPAPAPPPAVDKPRPRKRITRVVTALIALILFGALMLVAVLPRLARYKKITAAAQAVQNSIPNGSVVQVQVAPASSDLQLPGDVEAIQVATIAAQTTGYLRKFHADIGDR